MAGETFNWRCPTCAKLYKLKVGKKPPKECPRCVEAAEVRFQQEVATFDVVDLAPFADPVPSPPAAIPSFTADLPKKTRWQRASRAAYVGWRRFLAWNKDRKARREAQLIANFELEKRLYQAGGYQIICPNPNCGFKGRAKQEAKANGCLGVILLLFWILPGIIYFALMSGYRYRCPKCGMQIASD